MYPTYTYGQCVCVPYLHMLVVFCAPSSTQPHSWTWDEDTFSELAHFKRDKREEKQGLGEQLAAGGAWGRGECMRGVYEGSV